VYTEATRIKKKEHGKKLAAKYGKPSTRDFEWSQALSMAFGDK